MTKREAAIVTAYTGTLIGTMPAFQEYAEEKLGRPIMTHELGSGEMWDELRAAALEDFVSIPVT